MRTDRTRAKIQARFQIASRQPFDLLAAIGSDCVGAIQLCSVDATTLPQDFPTHISNSIFEGMTALARAQLRSKLA